MFRLSPGKAGPNQCFDRESFPSFFSPHSKTAPNMTVNGVMLLDDLPDYSQNRHDPQ